VRPYLGKRRPPHRTGLALFGLQNFQLYLDDPILAELGVSLTDCAVSMARMLALMHWEVKCDGRDVEFVLGGVPGSEGPPTLDTVDAHEMQLWILDFNQVRTISMDEDGIRDAAEAFMINDPYYPRPLDTSEGGRRLWSLFRDAYLESSERLLELQRAEGQVVKWQGLPEAFLEAIVEAQRHLVLKRERAHGSGAGSTYG